MTNKPLIICRGGGDLATGIVYRLTKSGFRVLILETEKPAAIRRQVSFCEAVYDGQTQVEEITCVKIHDISQAELIWKRHQVPLLVDPAGDAIRNLKPDIVVDAIIAKRNLGTTMDMAPLVVGVGPGFTAGRDVHVVVETMRGHNLGRLITAGSAMPNTGIPGIIGGYAAERVLHAPAAGCMENTRFIGDVVKQGEEIARIHTADGNCVKVEATIDGIIRGLIRSDYQVTAGFKIADIDPRLGELQNCFTISDKSRAIAGSVLEAVCTYLNSRGEMA